MDYIELRNILMQDKPSEELRERREELAKIIPEFEETFDFDEWADSIDLAIQNGEIEEAQPPKAKEEIEFDLDDMF